MGTFVRQHAAIGTDESAIYMQEDSDGDGTGDACEDDADGDQTVDSLVNNLFFQIEPLST